MAETEGATGEGLSEAELERALAARRTLLARFATLASRLVGGDEQATSAAGDETEAETDEAFGETSPLEDRSIAASLAAESAEEAAALVGGGIVVALAPLPPPVRAVVSRATRTTLATPRALACALARQAVRRRCPAAAGTPAP